MVTLGDQTEWQENKLERLRYEYDLKPGDVVFDIGSYRNEFGNKIKELYGCQVESFEAHDNRAAWIYDGEIKLGGDYYWSSQFIEGGKTCQCVDINKIIDKYSEITLMKINIEGAEYELIKHMDLSKVKNIQVQFHLIDGKESYEEAKEKLLKTHSLDWRYPFVWENWQIND